jgi:hypothetical protein
MATRTYRQKLLKEIEGDNAKKQKRREQNSEMHEEEIR